MSTTTRNLERTPTNEREVTTQPQDSIELSLGTSGKVGYTVKVYGLDADEINMRLDAALLVAERHAAKLRGA